MNILITGGAGYIGTTLTQLLLDAGHRVRVFDSLLWGIDPILPFFRHPCYEFVHGDVRHAEKLKTAIQGMDMVIHLAAIVGAPACKQDPELAYQVNVTGTRNLDLVRNGHPVIYASTGSNYGAVEGVCTEETPLNPLTQYGRTKTEAEHLLIESGNMVGLRFATAFGLSPRLRLDLLVNDFTYKAVRERNLIIYEPHARRTFIHVADIARALVHAVENFDTMKDQVYNCGDNRMNATKMQIVELIQKQVPGFYCHAADIGKDPDARDYEVDYSRIQQTGFETTISLEDGIWEMVNAFTHLRVRNVYSNVG